MLEDVKKIINKITSFNEGAKLLNTHSVKIKTICDNNNIDYSHFKYIKYRKKENPNLINEVFNKLTVLEVFYEKTGTKKRKMAKFSCSCGGHKICRLDSVINGRIKSCGCMSKRRECMDGSNNPAFKGVKEVPNCWIMNYKHGAKRRNIKWDITIEQVYELLKKQEFKCALTDELLYFGRIRVYLETNASIDRIDSNKGYEINNIQIVTKNINIMKQTVSQDEFIRCCKLVSKKFDKDK